MCFGERNSIDWAYLTYVQNFITLCLFIQNQGFTLYNEDDKYWARIKISIFGH